MELWLVYTIASAILGWINAFFLKMIATNWYNKDFIFFVRYIFGALGAWILYISMWDWYEWIITLTILMIVLAFIKALFSYIITYSKVKSLENITATVFFPLYKTITIVCVSLVSIVIFWDKLWVKEIIGLLMWISIPFILINKEESKKERNMKQWVFFVLICWVSASIWAIVDKYINVLEYNIELFTFLFMILGIFISYAKYKNTKKKNESHNTLVTKTDIWFSVIVWLLMFASMYLFVKALTWNLAIVYTINSFNILIPIILSVIFYKEEMTMKKAFVIFLSIVSVILFI